ncbi:glycosyltransferase [Roseomonas terrae]|jgi:glycosyltransferase involved in cell wall biosynthesis|uniref:Glycosyltransferase n=1 Tax=Neoroseomonas terrae TaxID=424799 RepID=A0ABS5EG69_9PROT|nr:glycosyltransferase [Neoroseomonas terrae]MBR0650010.1 glycosyltransferase [Neoroseomonas terrae]
MTLIVAKFDEEAAADGIRPSVPFAGDWRIEARNEAAVPGIALCDEGLRFSAPAEAREILLSAPIAIPVEGDTADLQFSLAIETPDPDALKAAIRNVSLVRVTEKAWRPFAFSLAGSLLRRDEQGGLRLAMTAAWSLGRGQFMVELSFKAGTRPVTISRMVVDIGRVAAVRLPPEPRRLTWPTTAGKGQPLRVAVVTWEVNDNPLGRAYMLADVIGRRHGVEVLGSAFSRPTEGVWSPLRNSTLPIRSFLGGDMAAFLTAAQEFARTVDCDIVHVSKPRFPGLILALLLVHRLGCPVILDIDDNELGFFGPQARMIGLDELEAYAGTESEFEFTRPEKRFWTGVAEGLIASFANHTVANASLAERFGGRLIRHARDEAVFRPDPAARAAVRQRLGLTDADRVILFAGTPRRHKGLERLMAALQTLADPHLLLVVIGTVHDRGFVKELSSYDQARVRFLPDAPFSDLPDLLQMADGVCLLQDQASPITSFQTPAKLSDALSLGIPVAMTPVPTVTELGNQGLITLIHDEAGLQAWLRGIAANDEAPVARQRRLEWFDAEFSYAVNGARSERALAGALEAPVTWHADWTRLFVALNRHFGTDLPEAAPAWAQRGARAAPVVRRTRPIDLVCFWKQNDTGIYGRRHDMLLKYLRQNEQVGTIIQFDAPVRIDHLRRDELAGAGSPFHHGRLIADATARRFLEIDDEPGLLRRTFVYGRERGTSFLGRSLPKLDDYQAYVAEVVARHCRGNLIGWAWPIAPYHAEIASGLGFDLSVVDLVDDQRTMIGDPERALQADEAYRQTLAGADLVFANCAAVTGAFAGFSPHPIHVVPNACEFYAASDSRPRDLEDVGGTVVGYAGNLRSRIDIELMEEVVARRPGWTFVVIGSAHDSPDILRLRRHPNLRMLGPKPYEEALRYMRCFDVAIMPHLRNSVSDNMNPLKLYVYVALGIPVVSTDVANIDELRGRIAVASEIEDFIAKLDLAVARRGVTGPHRPPPAEELWPISWPQRVATMVGLCRKALLS